MTMNNTYPIFHSPSRIEKANPDEGQSVLKHEYVLFVPYDEIALIEMIPIATYLKSNTPYRPLFILRSSIFSDNHVMYLEKVGFEIFHPWAHPDVSDGPSKEPFEVSRRHKKIPSIRNKVVARIDSLESRRKVKKAVRRVVPELFWEIGKYWVRSREIKRLFSQKTIAALVLNGDTTPGFEPPFIKAANSKGIPSIIVPFSLITPMGNAKIRLTKKNFRTRYSLGTLKNRLIGKLMPSWVYEYENHKMLIYPSSWAIAGWIMGVNTQNPWSVVGGNATRVAVENNFIYSLFVGHGISKKKMVITGKPTMDIIFDAQIKANKQAIEKELGITSNDRVLLCAVPQLFEHEMLPWDLHQKEVEFLLSSFSDLRGVKKILSLHPRSDIERYYPIAEEYGMTIAKRSIYQLLPICDVYVATFSTTVMYAIGMAKPTVVIDLYNLGYTVYDNIPGVFVIRERENLEPILKRLFVDKEFYSLQLEAQRRESGSWITLDGLCTSRVAKEISSLILDCKGLEETIK